MRHKADHGRHERSSRVPLRSYLLAAMALLAAALAVAGLTGTFTARAAVTVPAVTAADRGAEFAPASETTVNLDKTALITAQARARAQAQAAFAAAHTYTVRSGQSMSGVAVKRCAGRAADWTGIYAASRARGWTAKNANVLVTGQHLWIACAYDARQLRFAPAPPPPAPVRAVAAVATARTGHGYSAPVVRRAAVPAPVSTYRAASGSYSYAGLEALWISAGGPAWAAPHAAEIAECESGGRTSAYNPSGATGLWQILGSVVPGNLYNAFTNALNAVSKFRASGDTFAQWVCR